MKFIFILLCLTITAINGFEKTFEIDRYTYYVSNAKEQSYEIAHIRCESMGEKLGLNDMELVWWSPEEADMISDVLKDYPASYNSHYWANAGKCVFNDNHGNFESYTDRYEDLTVKMGLICKGH